MNGKHGSLYQTIFEKNPCKVKENEQVHLYSTVCQGVKTNQRSMDILEVLFFNYPEHVSFIYLFICQQIVLCFMDYIDQ